MTDTKLIEAVRDTVLQFNHEHEGWPDPERVRNGGFDECLDSADSLGRRCIAAVIAHATSAIIDVRARNAGNFERKGAVWEAYDKAVLDCHAAVAALPERTS